MPERAEASKSRSGTTFSRSLKDRTITANSTTVNSLPRDEVSSPRQNSFGKFPSGFDCEIFDLRPLANAVDHLEKSAVQLAKDRYVVTRSRFVRGSAEDPDPTL